MDKFIGILIPKEHIHIVVSRNRIIILRIGTNDFVSLNSLIIGYYFNT